VRESRGLGWCCVLRRRWRAGQSGLGRWWPPMRSTRKGTTSTAICISHLDLRRRLLREAGATRTTSPTCRKKIIESTRKPHHDYHALLGTEWNAKMLDINAPREISIKNAKRTSSAPLHSHVSFSSAGQILFVKNAFLAGESDSVMGHSAQYRPSLVPLKFRSNASGHRGRGA
jgi:hypothetical protein